MMMAILPPPHKTLMSYLQQLRPGAPPWQEMRSWSSTMRVGLPSSPPPPPQPTPTHLCSSWKRHSSLKLAKHFWYAGASAPHGSWSCKSLSLLKRHEALSLSSWNWRRASWALSATAGCCGCAGGPAAAAAACAPAFMDGSVAALLECQWPGLSLCIVVASRCKGGSGGMRLQQAGGGWGFACRPAQCVCRRRAGFWGCPSGHKAPHSPTHPPEHAPTHSALPRRSALDAYGMFVVLAAPPPHNRDTPSATAATPIAPTSPVHTNSTATNNTPHCRFRLRQRW